MGELPAMAILAAWMWREWEHSRERRALWERVAGISIGAETAPPRGQRVFGSDAEEWEIEQERMQGGREPGVGSQGRCA